MEMQIYIKSSQIRFSLNSFVSAYCFFYNSWYTIYLIQCRKFNDNVLWGLQVVQSSSNSLNKWRFDSEFSPWSWIAIIHAAHGNGNNVNKFSIKLSILLLIVLNIVFRENQGRMSLVIKTLHVVHACIYHLRSISGHRHSVHSNSQSIQLVVSRKLQAGNILEYSVRISDSLFWEKETYQIKSK